MQQDQAAAGATLIQPQAAQGELSEISELHQAEQVLVEDTTSILSSDDDTKAFEETVNFVVDDSGMGSEDSAFPVNLRRSRRATRGKAQEKFCNYMFFFVLSSVHYS